MKDDLSRPGAARDFSGNAMPQGRRPPLLSFDPDRLLGQLEGDREDFVAVLEVFLDSSQPQLVEIRAAVQEGDAGRLERAAHRLKGALSAIHADPAYCLAEKLEEMGRGGDLAQSEALLEQFLTEMARLTQALDLELSE